MNRQEECEAFLIKIGWQDAQREAIPGDASARRYQRLVLGDRRAILMDAPVAAETAPCPVAASPALRARLGYNALARLAGPNLHAFIQLAEVLRSAGLHAPEIFGADARAGFCLIEDLGDDLFARVLARGGDEALLYGAAVDALVHLHQQEISRPASADYTLLEYDETAMLSEAALLIDWYWPFVKGGEVRDKVRGEYMAAWRVCLAQLSPPDTLVLRDYHAENLLWLPENTGVARVGIIDFQDGLWGHRAYDLASLLEDARRPVAPQLARSMITRYKAAMSAGQPGFSATAFEADYALLAAQRNAKILGIFARLVKRDAKPRYLEFMPLVRNYFAGDLARDAVTPVRNWAQMHFPELLSP